MEYERYHHCPQCMKKGAYLKLGQEDWWNCRYCNLAACNSGESAHDVFWRGLIAKANPDRNVWVSDRREKAE